MDDEGRDQDRTDGARDVQDEWDAPTSDAVNDQASRQAALRALAQRQTQRSAQPYASAQAPTTVQLRGGRAQRSSRGASRSCALIAAALAVVVAVIGVAGLRYVAGRKPNAPAPQTTLRLNPPADNLGCVAEIAWSPDGAQIAALGDLQGQCGAASAQSQTDAVYIYNASSGKLIAQLHPDPAVFDSETVSRFIAANTTPASPPAMISLYGLTWAPNSQALLATFGVSIPLPGGQSPQGQSGAEPSIGGVLRLAVGHTTQTTLWIDTSNSAYQPNVIARWDLATGKLGFVTRPPATTVYRWNGDGTLSAAGSAAGKPVGAPNRGQTFSIWQPGALQVATGEPSQANPQPQFVPQDILWQANISAVSPDGRYFYPFVPAFGSVMPPSTKRVYQDEAPLAPHDQALVAIAQQMSAAAAQANTAGAQSADQQQQTLLAWRPDGRLLAALTEANPASNLPMLTVSLYDTTTGKLVKRLKPNFAGLQTNSAGNAYLAWSPDGKRLLLYDNIYGAIALWGPGALPA